LLCLKPLLSLLLFSPSSPAVFTQTQKSKHLRRRPAEAVRGGLMRRYCEPGGSLGQSACQPLHDRILTDVQCVQLGEM